MVRLAGEGGVGIGARFRPREVGQTHRLARGVPVQELGWQPFGCEGLLAVPRPAHGSCPPQCARPLQGRAHTFPAGTQPRSCVEGELPIEGTGYPQTEAFRAHLMHSPHCVQRYWVGEYSTVSRQLGSPSPPALLGMARVCWAAFLVFQGQISPGQACLYPWVMTCMCQVFRTHYNRHTMTCGSACLCVRALGQPPSATLTLEGPFSKRPGPLSDKAS